jgi:hypothetical protein
MKLTTQSTGCRRAVQIAAMGALLAIPTGLMAITVDGNVQGFAEGYTSAYDVAFDLAAKNPLPGGNDVPGGKLYTSVNGSILNVGFIAPLSIDDNLYGTATTSDWGSHTHTYSELTGSDEWVMSIVNGAGKTFAITIDYGVPTALTTATYDGKAIAAGKISFGTSLNYDVTVVDTSAGAKINSPSNPNWISNIEYEWSIDFTGLAGTFTVQNLLDSFTGSGGPDYFHMSPNKLGDNKVYPDNPTPSTVPDAGATATLLGLALLGVGGLSRKLRKV